MITIYVPKNHVTTTPGWWFDLDVLLKANENLPDVY
jgi:hypothetical protein